MKKDKLDIIIDLIRKNKVSNEEAKILLQQEPQFTYTPTVYYSDIIDSLKPPYEITCN